MGQKEHQYGHLYSAVWHYANSFTPAESPQTCSELLTTVVCLWRQNESQACVQCTRYCLRNENKCPTRLYFELLVSHLILPYIFTQTKIVTNNSLTKERAPHNKAHWERDCEEAFHQIFLQRGTYLTKNHVLIYFQLLCSSTKYQWVFFTWEYRWFCTFWNYLTGNSLLDSILVDIINCRFIDYV